MFAILHSLAMFVIDLFKSPRRLEAENLFLRHQLSIALRRAPPRLRLRGSDRALLVWMTRLWPSLHGATQVVTLGAWLLRWRGAQEAWLVADLHKSRTELKPGTLLTREWDGHLQQVMVLADGFSWNGKTYPSLSKVAFAVTGSRWNGPKFFGLRDKAASEARP